MEGQLLKGFGFGGAKNKPTGAKGDRFTLSTTGKAAQAWARISPRSCSRSLAAASPAPARTLHQRAAALPGSWEAF